MKRVRPGTQRPPRLLEIISIAAILFGLVSFAIGNPMAIAQESGPEPLVAQALQANPELKSIDLQVQALRHKADAVQMWMDPVFMVEYSNFPIDTWSLGDSPMTGVQFKLQQTFSLAGKNSRREATAQAEVKTIGWSLEEKRNQLAGLVKQMYWSLALVRQLRVITQKHIDLVGQLLEAIRAKYQVGKVGQHDLMRLEVLKSKLEDDLGEFDRSVRELTAVLNAAMHRAPVSHIATPEQTNLSSPTKSLTDWFELAKSKRPALKGLKAMAKAKRLAADAAGYERWPDITVWAGYRIRRQAGMDDGTDQMTLGLGIPLPLNYTGSSNAKKAMRLSEASAVEEQEIALLDEIHSSLEAALAAWERADQKANHYMENLIPRANETLESTLTAYQSDRADFASLYQAELQLLDFERTLLVARSQTWIQQAVIQTLSGTHTSDSE